MGYNDKKYGEKIEWGSVKVLFGVGGYVVFLIEWLRKFLFKRWFFSKNLK